MSRHSLEPNQVCKDSALHLHVVYIGYNMLLVFNVKGIY